METVAVIVVAILVVTFGGALAAGAYGRKRRTESLQDHFGSEYHREVAERGRTLAEEELLRRQRTAAGLDIRSLNPISHNRYAAAWQDTQGRFIDSPKAAIRDADELVRAVMRERGYPVDDLEAQAAALSARHPEVMANYRAAHGISEADRAGRASTEDMRQAMVHYRALFELLLDGDTGEVTVGRHIGQIDLREEQSKRQK